MRIFFSACLLFFLSASSFAAIQPSDSTVTLQSVSVTGSRVPFAPGRSARLVTVLDSSSIVAVPASSVNDLLKVAAGLDVRQRGAAGMQTDIGIRGGGADQIAVLLNGVSVADPQTGHNAFDFPVDPSDIERIEVLAGPAARTCGTTSLMGAVNVITRVRPGAGTLVRLEGGSYGYLGAGVNTRYSSGKYAGSLSAGYSRSDGYTRNAEGGLNTDFRARRVFHQGAYTDRNVTVRWHGGLSVRDFGANTFYSARFDDQFEHTLKSFAAVQAETSVGAVHLHPAVYWNHGEDRFELFRGAPDKYPFNYHRTNVLGLNLGGWFESVLGKTAFGAEMRDEDIISTNLGEPLPAPVPVRGEDAQYRVGLNRADISFYLDHGLTLKALTLSVGVTAAENTGNHDGFRLYPGADARLALTDALSLYASWNTSLRMPTFTELYYSVGGHLADKNLLAERMRALEGGLKYDWGGLQASLSVWHHRGRNLIDWIRDLADADAPWRSVNHTRIDALGEDLQIRANVPVLLQRPSFPLRSLSLTYGHIRQHKEEEAAVQSYYSLEYLRNKWVVQADAALAPGLTLTAIWRLHDRVGTYQPFFRVDGVMTAGDPVDYEPYSLVDAKLSWDIVPARGAGRTVAPRLHRCPPLRVFLSAENLLDREWVDHGNVPQPGRWIKAGLQLDIQTP